MNIKEMYSERKRKKTLPVTAVCRNCGNGLYGRYCHICGQDLFKSTKRTLSSMAFHAMENILSIDNKLFVTMKCLLFQPGKLTKEYTNGRIVRYVHPSKLFWFISILFFALLTTTLSDNDKTQKNTSTTEVAVAEDINLIETPENNSISTNKATKKNSGNKTSKKEKENTSDEDSDKPILEYKFKNNFMKYAPYASFLLIPFFAVLLNIFFRKKELFYIDHLTFALHFHAFIFILFSLYILINKVLPDHDSELYMFLIIPLIYFTWALWTVYRPKIGTLIFKMFAIFIAYGIAILSTIVLLFITAIKISGMSHYLD